MITRVALPAARYGQHARTVVFFDALYERLRGAPGIQRVGATTSLPFDGPDSRLNLTIEHPTGQSPFPVRAHPRIVSTDYFQTMGIPLGQRISQGAASDWREIVGVVGDTRHEGLDADADPAAFLPQHQAFFDLGRGFERTITIVIRASGDAASIAPLLRTSVASIDPQLPIGPVRPMGDLIGDSVAPRRLNFVLVSAFAFVALVLTASGLYGVMSYVVAQRTREIGVRMALGATRSQVLAMMFRQAGTMTLVGIGTGIAGALVLTRSMSSLLFGVSAADPAIYIGVSLIFAIVACLAVAVPSLRATRVDPLAALRDS